MQEEMQVEDEISLSDIFHALWAKGARSDPSDTITYTITART